ncbi:MAG TPA: hypothetical protein PL182_04565, partial [Pseudobdellovibrionaceae bacterium]|nr:hypothetical protein [Pseudobdellovibrionaceae bacterium]
KEASVGDLGKLSQARLKVEKLTDARTLEPKARIGEYSEKEDSVLYVETSSDVAEFVTNGMKDSLTKAGVQLVEDNPQYTLSGEVRELYVTEKNTYQGRSSIQLTLKKNGKAVWEGVIRGKNSRFGRTYKMENYMESLSDSVADTTIGLLGNDGFLGQFAK